jgi:hypothetical protein
VFKKRVLQKTVNGSREASSAADKANNGMNNVNNNLLHEPSGGVERSVLRDSPAVESMKVESGGGEAMTAPHDEYADLEELLAQSERLVGEWRDGRFVYRKHKRKLYNPTLAETAGLRAR